MKYIGSKNKYAKELLPIILKDRKPNQYYVEPFCGGCNIIDKVENPRIANDNHYYLIELLRALANGWQPPTNITEEDYYNIKPNYLPLLTNHQYSSAIVGFVGFCCSYSGKWWGGYARGNTNNGQPRNYCAEARKNLLKQAPKLKGIEFYNTDYKNLVIPTNSIVYADPPYVNTQKYNKQDINYDEFWNWCRTLVQDGHSVFISEYNAPDYFKCIWSKEVYNTLDKDTSAKKGIEKLWVKNN